MNRRSTTTAILAAGTLVALLSGCAGDGDAPETVAPNTSTAPPDAASATTGSDAAGSTGAPPGGADTAEDSSRATGPGDTQGALPTVPTDYADTLVRAWGSGDQPTMQRLATDEVIHTLGDRGGPSWEQTSAEGAAGSTIVTYTNTEDGDTLALRVQNSAVSAGEEHAVVEATYAPGGEGQDELPSAPTDYADTLVVAWGTEDQATLHRMATDEVVQTLGDHGSPNWSRISAEGAAGSTIVTYTETATGEVLVLRVDNVKASEGANHAVVEAHFEDG